MSEQDPFPTNVGCRTVEVADLVQDATIAVRVLYPTEAPARAERFGPYELELAMGAPLPDCRLRLVTVSHGNGGSPWTHRGLAAHLARTGHAVALFEHPGNSRSDNSLAGTVANLENRPRHLRLVIDAILADPELGPALAPGVAVIGHSIGGYTALVAAGGRPLALPHEMADGKAAPLSVTADPRVHALVLFAPAVVWLLAEAALEQVTVPIFLRSGEHDVLIPPAHIDGLVRGVRGPIDHAVVAGAGHFAFQSPFPAAMTRPEFPPSQDPPGFDRARYQQELGTEVSSFLERVLAT